MFGEGVLVGEDLMPDCGGARDAWAIKQKGGNNAPLIGADYMTCCRINWIIVTEGIAAIIAVCRCHVI